MIKNLIKKLIKTSIILIIIFLSYFLISTLLSKITVNKDFIETNKEPIEIYLISNGVHTDIGLPIINEFKDWSKFVNSEYTKSKKTDFKYVAFGWGDKGFYLDTPTWSDLKFSSAFIACFYLGTTAMHVTFYNQFKENEQIKKIRISKDQYLKLISFIEQSFQIKNNKPILIENASYGKDDIFYEAIGTYSIFYTCNSWTNQALKESGLRACFWTLFESSIMENY